MEVEEKIEMEWKNLHLTPATPAPVTLIVTAPSSVPTTAPTAALATAPTAAPATASTTWDDLMEIIKNESSMTHSDTPLTLLTVDTNTDLFNSV